MKYWRGFPFFSPSKEWNIFSKFTFSKEPVDKDSSELVRVHVAMKTKTTGSFGASDENWKKEWPLQFFKFFFLCVSGAHKPCLARAAVTSCAKVDRWGDSVMLMLPLEDRRGEVPPVSIPGEWVTTISAPWSTRALADSRKLSLWLSIYLVGGK